MSNITIRLTRGIKRIFGPPKQGDTIRAVSYGATATIREVATENWTADSQPRRVEFLTKSQGGEALETVASCKPVGWAYWSDDNWHLCKTEPVIYPNRREVFILDMPFRAT